MTTLPQHEATAFHQKIGHHLCKLAEQLPDGQNILLSVVDGQIASAKIVGQSMTVTHSAASGDVISNLKDLVEKVEHTLAEVSQDELDRLALKDPRPGDSWSERAFCVYFLVVAVDGENITVLSCLGNAGKRIDELDARVIKKDHWEFDYSKAMVVTKEWMRAAVSYSFADGFCAHVNRTSDTMKACVQEWKVFNNIE